MAMRIINETRPRIYLTFEKRKQKKIEFHKIFSSYKVPRYCGIKFCK